MADDDKSQENAGASAKEGDVGKPQENVEAPVIKNDSEKIQKNGEALALLPESWSTWRARLGRRRAWLFAAEWGLRWAVYGMNRTALFSALSLIGNLAILGAVYTYLSEGQARRDASINQAWTLLMTAEGKTGDGGRRSALQTLAQEVRPLFGLPLRNATIYKVNLDNTIIVESNFRESRILDSSFDWVDGRDLDFSGSTISFTKFRNARLSQSKFAGAFLDSMALTDSSLWDVDFANSVWCLTPFKGAHFERVSFLNATRKPQCGPPLEESIRQAKYICDVTMPDGSKDTRNCARR